MTDTHSLSQLGEVPNDKYTERGGGFLETEISATPATFATRAQAAGTLRLPLTPKRAQTSAAPCVRVC